MSTGVRKNDENSWSFKRPKKRAKRKEIILDRFIPSRRNQNCRQLFNQIEDIENENQDSGKKQVPSMESLYQKHILGIKRRNLANDTV